MRSVPDPANWLTADLLNTAGKNDAGRPRSRSGLCESLEHRPDQDRQSDLVCHPNEPNARVAMHVVVTQFDGWSRVWNISGISKPESKHLQITKASHGCHVMKKPKAM